jgi:hypothetical protein
MNTADTATIATASVEPAVALDASTVAAIDVKPRRSREAGLGAGAPPSQPPGPARATSTTSGEGSPIRDATAPSARQRALVTRPERRSLAGQLLRHSLVTPEKRTLKRIDALRQTVLAAMTGGADVDVSAVGARIYDHLRQDRGLNAAVSDAGFITLAEHLLQRATLGQTAASVVGAFLRGAGGIERGRATPERVKAALAALCDALYDLDHPAAPIPSLVRDVQVEKRDGGLQLVAVLRQHAADDEALVALRRELDRTGYSDIDVRVHRLLPPDPGTR